MVQPKNRNKIRRRELERSQLISRAVSSPFRENTDPCAGSPAHIWLEYLSPAQLIYEVVKQVLHIRENLLRGNAEFLPAIIRSTI